MLFCVEFCQDMEGVKWNQFDLGQHLMIYCLANLVQSKCVSKHALADPKYKFCMGS